MKTLPGLTTNVEFGAWVGSGKVVFGAPEGAPHVRYLEHYAAKHRAPIARDLAGVLPQGAHAARYRGAARARGADPGARVDWSTMGMILSVLAPLFGGPAPP